MGAFDPEREVRAMADDRYIQILEEQLRDANATNADLRERVADIDRRKRHADARLAEANALVQQLEKAHARQKRAENVAATSRRKREDAERQVAKLSSKNEELRERLDGLQEEVDAFRELNDRVERAKTLYDVFS
jgi:chromosome segregation ATPase